MADILSRCQCVSVFAWLHMHHLRPASLAKLWLMQVYSCTIALLYSGISTFTKYCCIYRNHGKFVNWYFSVTTNSNISTVTFCLNLSQVWLPIIVHLYEFISSLSSRIIILILLASEDVLNFCRRAGGSICKTVDRLFTNHIVPVFNQRPGQENSPAIWFEFCCHPTISAQRFCV